MRIPTRPKEVSTTLAEHRELDDAPVFVYRFPTPEEQAEIIWESVRALQVDPETIKPLEGLSSEDQAEAINRLMSSGKADLGPGYILMICGLFDRFISRIENLEVGDPPEAFVREKHLGDIRGGWKVEVGKEILDRTKRYLTGLEEGNSSSPSNSAETEPDTASAAADDAS